jgi:hypothetical protein
VEYFGHIVCHEGVKVDPNKIKSMREWTISKTMKKIKGLLGMIGYYYMFFKKECQIETPLTILLKNEKISWTEAETKYLKNIMMLCVQLLS